MSDTKASNPKEAFGSTKAQLSLVPWTLMVCAARALLEGALKYGRFNWRIAGVKASTYLDALKRHVAKWENGQDFDKKTRVHHLDNAIACLCILRDAEVYGMLNDDRPPCPNPDRMAELIDGEGELIAHLKYEFREHSPKQYTIADTPRGDTRTVQCEIRDYPAENLLCIGLGGVGPCALSHQCKNCPFHPFSDLDPDGREIHRATLAADCFSPIK